MPSCTGISIAGAGSPLSTKRRKGGAWLQIALLLLLTTTLATAGPLEFGRAELNAALAARKIEPALVHVITEMSADPAGSYRIEGSRIFGGDLRGLMYGLLEAAEQIRATGKLVPTKAIPACQLRGVRISYQNQPKEFWTNYIQMLARNRFNRLNVVFPQDPNLERVDELSQTATDHGMDFVLTFEGEAKDLTAILTRCKNIRAIRLQSTPEQAFEPIRRAGHLVTLELDNAQTNPSLLEAAKQAGIPIRLSSSYTKPAFEPKLLWGDPGYVRRTVPIFTINGGTGFELDAPSDPERFWLFYMLWGRLGYDLKTPDKVWLTELQRRFGPAAADALEAYRNTTVEPPNTNVKEAVQNRIKGIPSARQTPVAAAAHLQKLAVNLERAVAGARKSIDPENPSNNEWKSSEADFLTLAAVAKYYARMQMAADQLEGFEQTGADSGLYAAQRELRGASRQWDRVANKYQLDQPNVKQVEDRVTQYEQSEHAEHPPQPWPAMQPRPAMEHIPPAVAEANQPLPITLKLPHGYLVRLHYGPNFTTIENETGHFTIPAAALTLNQDLVYYFEVLPAHSPGWLQPDPQVAAPYYIVKVQPAPPPKEDPGKLPSTGVPK